MVTHNMARAISLGTRLIMMDKGEIIMDVSGQEKQPSPSIPWSTASGKSANRNSRETGPCWWTSN